MSSSPLFNDRTEAGKQLAQSVVNLITELKASSVSASPIVYALPRGGIPVAVPIARQLSCPLDVMVAKKIVKPENPELAIGAVTSEGHVLWTQPRLFPSKYSPVRDEALRQAQEKAQAQLKQLAPGRPDVNPEGALAILVDDGIATGMTMAAAAKALKAHNPAEVWICAPVAPPGLLKALHRWSDRVIILETPDPFMSVSRFYQQFPQVETADALAQLQQHNHLLLSTRRQSLDNP
jgi:putative phosphoribosyl transferase